MTVKRYEDIPIMSLEGDTEHARALFARTKGWLESNHISELITLVNGEIERDARYTAPYVLKARAHLRQNDVEEARSTINQLSRPYREWSSVYSTIGAVALAEKNYQEAVENFERAAELETNIEHQAEHYQRLGASYSGLNDWKQASIYHKLAYTSQPKLFYLVSLYFGINVLRFSIVLIPLYTISLMLSIWMTSWWILIPIAIIVLFHGSMMLLSLLGRDWGRTQRQAYQTAFYIIVATVIRQLLERPVPW